MRNPPASSRTVDVPGKWPAPPTPARDGCDCFWSKAQKYLELENLHMKSAIVTIDETGLTLSVIAISDGSTSPPSPSGKGQQNYLKTCLNNGWVVVSASTLGTLRDAFVVALQQQ